MDGILLVNKPKEYTSHDVVSIVKKISKEKVGHTGTLDPMATGVLPLLIGKATLISKYLINHDKTYIATVKLGIKTDTADSEGKIIEEKEVSKLNKELVEKALKSILGKQEQIPPMYSAIKVNGKKLYEYAREGQTVEVKPRQIEIYDTKLIDFKNETKEMTFEVSCSKGTYIRTVCETIAERLNTVGYMKELKRTRVGEFKIEDSVSIEDTKEDADKIESNLITIEELFKNFNDISIRNKELELLINGVKIKTTEQDGVYRIYNNNYFIGLGIVNNNQLKRDIIIA